MHSPDLGDLGRIRCHVRLRLLLGRQDALVSTTAARLVLEYEYSETFTLNID